jgi:hypothetical protein
MVPFQAYRALGSQSYHSRWMIYLNDKIDEFAASRLLLAI